MKCGSNKKTNHSTKRLAVSTAVGLVLIGAPILSVFLDTEYHILLYITRIAVGSMYYDLLAQENAGIVIQVYVFNVTNSEAFLSGEEDKLRVEEVGPFTYQEYRKNDKFEVDEGAGVMRYVPRTRAEFRPNQSIEDPELVNITVPNAAMLAISSMVSSYPFWTKSGFTMLADNLHSKPIINVNVHNFLWGYDDPMIALFNSLMPGWITFSKMGILDRLYDESSLPMLEVSIGSADKFQVKKTDKCAGLKMWQYEDEDKRTRCNTFVDAYEGFAYPPRLTHESSIRLYRNIFCRMLDLNYVGTTATDVTSEALVYQISNNSYSINSNTECLCGRTSECIDGISDISPCLFGLTIGLSNGHFLNANPEIYNRIDGMRPDEKEHGSEFIIEPKLGAILSGQFSVQVNVIVKDVNFYSRVKRFSKMVVPLAYIKIVQPELEEDVKNSIRMSINALPNLVHGIELVIFIIGLMISTYALHQMYLQCKCFGSYKIKDKHNGQIQVQTPLIHEKLPNFDIKKNKLMI